MAWILSSLIALPLIGFLVVLAFGKTQARARNIAVMFSLASLAMAALASAEYVTGAFSSFIPANKDALGFGFVEQYDWVPSLGMSYILGVDGISLPLVFLAPLLSLLGMIFSWDKDHRPREFFAM